jgi:hypothetical protein
MMLEGVAVADAKLVKLQRNERILRLQRMPLVAVVAGEPEMALASEEELIGKNDSYVMLHQ